MFAFLMMVFWVFIFDQICLAFLERLIDSLMPKHL